MIRVLRALAVSAVVALIAAACGPGSGVLRSAVDSARSNAGVDPAIDSPYLDLAALIESVNACSRANGGSAPAPTFDGETSVDTAYLTRTSPLEDADAAAQDILDSVPGTVGSAMLQPRWDRKGVATYRCPDDGLLYGTAVVSDFVAEPTGRYADQIYTEAEITVHEGLRYGTAPLCEPGGNDLFLDIYEPPVDAVTERPLMVVVHGGGFKSGDRTKFAAQTMAYAQQGYVAAAIQYRTCPSTFDTMTEPEQVAAATNAIDDGMESIRYLRANAATYGIDTDRVGVIGSSAGAIITYGTALLDDPTPGGPLGAFPFRPDAVVGTGGNLTPAIETPGFVADPPPVMMIRSEFDQVAGPGNPAYEWQYSYQTCDGIHAGGGICDFFVTPGTGHVTSVNPTGQYGRWFVPFFYEHLDLANSNEMQNAIDPDGFNVLYMGHSFGRPFASQMEDFAALAGVEGYKQHIVQRGGMGGSPQSLWANPETRPLIEAWLDTGEIDQIVLVCCSQEYLDSGFATDQAIWEIASYAIEQNPDTRVALAMIWADFPENYPDAAAHRAGTDGLYPLWEELAGRLSDDLAGADVFTFYHGAALYELRDLFERGELSDVAQLTGPKATSVFTDAKGHAGQIALDTGTLLWLAAINDVEPVDMPYFDAYELDIRDVAQDILADQRAN